MSAPATGAGVGPNDRAVIAGELGRTPRGLTGVAVRCPFGYPAVTESAPVFAEGSPNPTLLYVTCPALDAVISRVEGAGGVRDLRAACQEDYELRGLLEEITGLYRRRRVELHSQSTTRTRHDVRLGAGIGGPEHPEQASCLHAYAAALSAVISGWLQTDDPGLVERAQQAWSRFLPPLEEAWCDDRRCAKWITGEKKAVIDVGTISVRLLIADVVDGRPWTLVRKAEVTRLGEGLMAGAPLNEAARERTAEVVGSYAAEARLQGVDRVLLVGTSAAREASDGQEFIRSLAERHDLRARVITGDEEAKLAYAGASLDVPEAVVLDIGGGSTELVGRAPAGQIVAHSLALGASRATERWVKNDPPAAEELDAIACEAARELAGLRDLFGMGVAGEGQRRLVGVAGTVTTLAALSAGLEKYDSNVVHLRILSLDEVCAQLARLAGMTTQQRAALPCVQAGRAPVIVAGAAILMAAMEVLGYQDLTVSERDLLDGLMLGGV
jgi:exopolyphosphatase/guanosine-5'-triphosphate,3'-diphosphate pyrophosphatase